MENVFAPYELNFDDAQRKKLFGEALRELREQKRYMQIEVAEFLGIKSQTYNGYETGRSEPNLETLVRLSFLFDCPLDAMLQKYNFVGTKEQMLKEFDRTKLEFEQLEQDTKDKPIGKDLQSFIGMMGVMFDKLTEAIELEKKKKSPSQGNED